MRKRTGNMKYFKHKTTEVEKGAKIGEGTKIWHNSQVLKGARIGERCVIGHNCFISSKAKLGKGVKLQSNIDVWDLVILDDYVFVGPSAVFTNDLSPRAKYPKKEYSQYGRWLPTLVKEGATIGANATILCGITIGKWAMVGAGAVVTKNVDDYVVVVGVPAKITGWVCGCGTKLRFVSRISANKGANKCEYARCRVCKRKYFKRGEKVSRC